MNTKKLFILGAAAILLFAGSFLSPQKAEAVALCDDLGGPTANIRIPGYGDFRSSQENQTPVYNITVASGTVLSATFFSYADPSSYVREEWPYDEQVYGGPCGQLQNCVDGRLHESAPITQPNTSSFEVTMIQFCQEYENGPTGYLGPEGSVTVNITVTVPPPVQRTLNITKTGTGSGTVTSNPAGINCGGDCTNQYDNGTSVALTGAPATGSVFAGWTNCQTSSNANISVSMNANKTCTARFDTTARYACNAAGTACVASSTGQYTTSNCNNACTATPTHYSCGGANGTCVSDPSGTYTTSNCDNACSSGIHYACNSAGSCVVSSTGSYLNSSCDNACTTPTHYSCNNANTACIVNPDGPYTTSNCNNNCGVPGNNGPYTLEVRKDGAGTGIVSGNPPGNNGDDILCGSNCDALFNASTSVTLHPAADDGSRFLRWYGDCSGGSNATVVMNANKICTARFIPDTYCTAPSTITVTSTLPARWTITGPESFTQNTSTTNAQYVSHSRGTYVLTAGQVAGYTSTITPAAAQTIASCGQGLGYTITYTANTQRYACNAGGSCVSSSTGAYTTSNCNNACGGNQTRYACNSNNSCIVSSTGAYTTSNCNNACGGNQTRYACNAGGTCEQNPFGTYVTSNCDNACGVPPPPAPAFCTFTAAPKIISIGGSSALSWSCTGVESCTVTNLATGATVPPPENGPSGKTTVSPGVTTAYELRCARGFFSTSTTVRVRTLQECNPGDPTCNPVGQ